MLRLDINLLFTVLNILIWFVLIRLFLFKPVNKVISKREEAIASRYAEAERLREQAKEEKEKCALFQSQIKEEQEKAVAEVQEKAHMEYDRIVTEARKKAEQIMDTSKKEAEQQKKKILGKAAQEIRKLILDTSARSIETSRNDQALYEQFLTKAGEQHEEH